MTIGFRYGSPGATSFTFGGVASGDIATGESKPGRWPTTQTQQLAYDLAEEKLGRSVKGQEWHRFIRIAEKKIVNVWEKELVKKGGTRTWEIP
jgi:hypothetical protein